MDDILVEKAAHDVLSAFYIAVPEDIDVDIFAAHLGAAVLYEPLKNAEAMLIRRGTAALIYADPKSGNRGRIRFAVAHEIGHLLLHANNSQAWLCSETEGTLADYHKSRQEIEANMFAAHLLMPRRIFGAEVDKTTFSVSGIDSLAKRYAVSLLATARRFVDESREDSMIILSEEGRVKWFHGSIKIRGGFLKGGQVIHTDSDAVDCMHGKGGYRDLTPIAPHIWFPEMRDGFVLYEQSVKLGSFPWILTLLKVEPKDETEDDFEESPGRDGFGRPRDSNVGIDY